MVTAQPAAAPNYLDRIAGQLGELVPDCEPELLRIYAVLVLVKGRDVTPADVHHAWAVWTAPRRPDHPSLVPFEDLAPEVQRLDDRYAEAIAEVSARMGAQGA